MMKKKTEYYFDMGPRLIRRIWEDENGWFTMIRGERCEVNRKYQHFFIKHQDSLKVGKKEAKQ